MDTPICDFVRRYAQSGALRCHMPGHKGQALLGMEGLDITEITGADSLYEADGIIARSETNAGSLFVANTFYSTEGSSLCIRAMLHLAALHARKAGKAPLIAAARNAHKVFLSAVALLDLEVRLHRQKRETAPQSMDDPITTEYAQNCQMYDFIAGLADLLSGGTAQQKEDEIAYLTEGGVLDRYEALLQKEVIEYADIF